MPSENYGVYATRLAPIGFDFMVAWLYWPASIGSIREALVDLLQLGEKTHVLEFGSGTGGITARMLRRGAQVTCVDRSAILKNARSLLAPGGFAVVADSAAPAGGLTRTLWRGFVRSFEPASVLEVLDGALEHEIREAGFEIVSTREFAGGRAAAYVAQPR